MSNTPSGAYLTLGEKLLLVLFAKRGQALTLAEVMQEKHDWFGDDTDHGTAAVTVRLRYLIDGGYVVISHNKVGATTYQWGEDTL